MCLRISNQCVSAHAQITFKCVGKRGFSLSETQVCTHFHLRITLHEMIQTGQYPRAAQIANL